MADGSSGHTKVPTAVGEFIATAPVAIGEDFIIDFGVPADDCNAEELNRVAARLVRVASATLRVALMRGDNDSDMPNTFNDSIEGAAMLLQLSLGLQDGAKKLASKAG